MGDAGDFDLIIIGSGPAGEAAADVVRAQKRSVAVIEKDKLGGDCPNYACVPTKALLRSARIYSLLRRADEFGLRARDIGFDWDHVVARKERIVAGSGDARKETEYRKNDTALFRGAASFVDAHHVQVGDATLRGEKILIATGSQPQMPPIAGIEEARPITNIEAVRLPALPQSLIILGGGAVGCEFAYLFAVFGVEVTLLEAAAQIAPQEEPEISAVLRAHLEQSGVRILTGLKVTRMTQAGRQKTVQATAAGKETRELRAEEILIALGREPRTQGLNLAAAGVETDEKGFVKINAFLQTTRPHIFAAGDVAGPYLFTHTAHYQGTRAARNLLASVPRPVDYRVVPRVTWTDPEIASVGLTEQEARERGHDVLTATAPLDVLGKAQVDTEPAGMAKIVADARSGEILGGHIVGADAGEMIHEIVGAMAARARVADLADVMHAFPTFAEGIVDAACAWMDARQAASP